MASLMPVAKQQYFIPGTAIPLVGGKLYTYAAGTSTPKTTWQDAAGTIPNTNPITLDSAGAALIYWDGSYKIVLKDALGNTVYSVDNYKTDPYSLQDILPSLAASTGSSLVGFIQSGPGAVDQTQQEKDRRVIDPEDFGAIGDGVADDTEAIQAAINSFAPNACCAVRFTPGKTYRITSMLSNNDRSVVFDGNNAIILVDGNMSYGLKITALNCEVRNLQINKSATATVTAAIYATGLQHVFRNVTSRSQTWPLFALCQDLKESHFTNIRVDNDPTDKTGVIFQFDYCVNNTISNSMLGFCAQALYGSSTPQPTSGYHNEGLLICNVITVYAGKAVNFDNGTFIAISNCCFDFTELQGIFMSNGTDLNVTNTWVASNTTDGFIGIGTLAAVDGVSVQNCTFVRGVSPIASTSGLSLPGPNALVIGNRFKSGMNGGVVTQATSQVIGNVVTGGGTGINATGTQALIGGKLNVSSDLSVGGNEGIFPEGVSGSATAGSNGAPPAQVAGYATFTLGGSNFKLPYYNP